MKESKLTKILISIATILICSAGCYGFTKIVVGHFHMHPPTESDVDKTRERVKKDIEKYGNKEAKDRAAKGDVPFVKKKK